jgi:hypothetical protein
MIIDKAAESGQPDHAIYQMPVLPGLLASMIDSCLGNRPDAIWAPLRLFAEPEARALLLYAMRASEFNRRCRLSPRAERLTIDLYGDDPVIVLAVVQMEGRMAEDVLDADSTARLAHTLIAAVVADGGARPEWYSELCDGVASLAFHETAGPHLSVALIQDFPLIGDAMRIGDAGVLHCICDARVCDAR